MEYIPYVYFVKHRSTGLKYIGVRYARGCNPSDFWVSYFTSSKSIHKLIKRFGKDDFSFRIIHKFPNEPEKAILREAKYFPLIKQREDYLNLTYSSGIQDLRVASKAGKIGGSIVYKEKIGIFRSEEERKVWASMGGKTLSSKEFCYWASNEGRKKRASMGGKVGAFTNPDIQRALGKRGGVKNKGFVWINNGEEEIKYTKKRQKQTPIDVFLEQNTNFKRGRLKNENKIN